METRTASGSRVTVMTLFALSCIGLLLFLWVSFGGTLPFRAQGYRFSVLLPESDSIQNQGDVRIAGVSVGKVVGVNLDGPDTRAVIQMDDQYAPIHRNAHITVRLKSLLDEVYLEMTPGTNSAPVLPDGGTIPASQVTTNVGLDQILNTFTPSIRNNLQVWLQNWAQGVNGTAPSISDDTVRFSEAAQGANGLLGVLQQQSTATSELIRDTGVTFGTIGSDAARVQQLITASDDVFRTTAARSADLEQTFHDLPPFLRGLQTTLAATQKLAGPGTPALTALEPAARLLGPTLTDALQLAPSLRSVARDLGPVLDLAPRGLSDARAVILGTVPLIPQLRFFARNAIPIVDYLYAYRQEFVESWPKAAAATNGLLYDPGSGHYLHYLRAPAVVPSEANAFAADRQPYSRSDAYMSPGGIADFKEDQLQDFNCAFTDDAVTVPAIPGGVPSCIQQAPWTFEGKTADYPQLKPAP
jgi:phospholipid/cholesterol/gamma-HCH transport system substrate-binding protein